ncbi:MAG: radical SAM protein [Candidatus Omnitrophota bacterium]|nr:radical SAM protein [Candidatus Omnitrophota bacterium]
MKVMLINPPIKYLAYVTADWDRRGDSAGAFPPLGLSYIAGYLVKNTRHDVVLLDADVEKLSYPEIIARILEYKPDIVGTTVFTPSFYDSLLLARMVKKNLPGCYFCVGGIQHVRMFLNETLSHPEIDFAVRGEGEEVFAGLLDALEKKTPLAAVEGVSFKENGRIVSAGGEGYIKDINELPSPAFDLLPVRKYTSAIGTGAPVGTIATSRGCPYECTFCDKPYRTYRSYTTERIISEMEYFYKRGIKEFVFFDDMFNLTPGRVIEISDVIIEKLPGIIWSFRGRVDQVTEEMLIRAKKAGCVQIMFGMEAAKNDDLKSIKKRVTTEQFRKSIALCKKAGIETSSNWIIGLPCHKSRQDVLDLIDFVIKSNTDYTQFNILVPYAGTELYREGVKKGILSENFWNDYVSNPTPNAYAPYWSEYMSREELSELLKMCFHKFYLRPSKIIDHVFKLKSISQFGVKFKGVLYLLGAGGFKRKNAESYKKEAEAVA